MYFNKKLLLYKIESSYGVDPTPTASANAILTRDCAIQTLQGQPVNLTYDRPTFGNFKAMTVGPYTVLSFKCDLQSSGTAGTLPAYDALLRSCGFKSTLLATLLTGTATAGSTNTITLAAGASALDDTYDGLLINITSGTGAGESARIKSYVGATKVATVVGNWTTPPDATSVYSIPAQVVYAPVSNNLESGTAYYFLDGELHALVGVRGTVDIELPKAGLPIFSFTLTGLRVAPSAVANPTPDFSHFIEPTPVNKTNTPAISVFGYSGPAESIKFSMQNKVTYRNVVQGEAVVLTDRQPTLNVAIEKPVLATKDFEAAIVGNTAGAVFVTHGTAAGKTVRIDGPNTQLTKPSYSGSDGIVLLTMDGNLLPSVGDDDVYITLT